MIHSQRILSRVTSGALRRRPAPTSTLAASVPATASSSYHTTAPTLDEDGPKTKQLKVKKKVKNSAKKAEGGRDRHLDLILRALDAPVLKPPPASEEEMQRRHDVGRAYNIGTWEQHNALHHDLNSKMPSTCSPGTPCGRRRRSRSMRTTGRRTGVASPPGLRPYLGSTPVSSFRRMSRRNGAANSLEKYGCGDTTCGLYQNQMAIKPFNGKCRTWLRNKLIFLCRNSQLYIPIGIDRHAPHMTHSIWMDEITAKPCV